LSKQTGLVPESTEQGAPHEAAECHGQPAPLLPQCRGRGQPRPGRQHPHQQRHPAGAREHGQSGAGASQPPATAAPTTPTTTTTTTNESAAQPGQSWRPV